VAQIGARREGRRAPEVKWTPELSPRRASGCHRLTAVLTATSSTVPHLNTTRRTWYARHTVRSGTCPHLLIVGSLLRGHGGSVYHRDNVGKPRCRVAGGTVGGGSGPSPAPYQGTLAQRPGRRDAVGNYRRCDHPAPAPTTGHRRRQHPARPVSTGLVLQFPFGVSWQYPGADVAPAGEKFEEDYRVLWAMGLDQPGNLFGRIGDHLPNRRSWGAAPVIHQHRAT
jgi:hypothetical protein